MRKHAFLIGFIAIVAAIVAVALSVRVPERHEALEPVAQAPAPAPIPEAAPPPPPPPSEPIAIAPPAFEQATPPVEQAKTEQPKRVVKRAKKPVAIEETAQAEEDEPATPEASEEQPQAEEPKAITQEDIQKARDEVERELAEIAPDAVPDRTYPGQLVFRENVGWVKPEAIDVRVDGKPLTGARDWVAIKTGQPIPLPALPMGTHRVDVAMRLAGDSNLFPYMKAYTFTLTRSALVKITGEMMLEIEALPQNKLAEDWRDRMRIEIHAKPAPGAISNSSS